MILYREYAPHPALSAHVDCLWTCSVRAADTPFTHQVLPDNCIDILWQDRQDDSFAVGMMTAPIQVVTHGLRETVAVRFKPGAARLFLSLPVCELTDQRADLHALWGRDAADRLADALWSKPLSVRARLDILERHLLMRLHGMNPLPGAALVQVALDAIEASGGAMRIETLAQQLGISRQHLAARFKAQVGLTPKMFARVCRFGHASARIRNAGAGQIEWPQLALELGYFDQSHLIHEFQAFAGAAPESFVLRGHG